MLDFLLASAHHLLIFGLLTILVMETVSVRPGLNGGQIRRVVRLDAGYGVTAALLVVVGFARVFLGPKGADFYLANPVFWAKIACFAAVALLSIFPTIRFIGWAQRAKRQSGFAPSAGDVLAIRRCLIAEAMIFGFIPVLAAAMARGYGL